MNQINIIKLILFTVFYLVQVKVHAKWDVDLTRRQTDLKKIENLRMPASVVSVDPTINADNNDKSSSEIIAALKRMANLSAPSKDIVIIQTEDGFIPSTLNVQKNQTYQIYVVNLNSKEKNVSFLMDSFSQSHNTVFGNVRSFKINPNVEGVFSYQSPETGAAGKLVVVEPSVEENKKLNKNKTSRRLANTTEDKED